MAFSFLHNFDNNSPDEVKDRCSHEELVVLFARIILFDISIPLFVIVITP
jgi:hypothetical protein